MNKESIYRLIGYQGIYSPSVKKALKKILKENHPDHNGNSEIFKLINEVKKELENNKVTYKIEINKKNHLEDIDYDYCFQMIQKLQKEKELIINEIDEKQKIKNNILNEYKDLYKTSINNATDLLNKGKDYHKLQNVKIISVIIIAILVILFVMAILNNNIMMFILFGILCFLMIIIISKYFLITLEYTKKSEKKVNKYLNTLNEIQEKQENKEKVKKEILELERKKEKIENNLRFYENIVKD